MKTSSVITRASLGDALRGVGEMDGTGERVFFTATGGG
jgi:hypothetical protein